MATCCSMCPWAHASPTDLACAVEEKQETAELRVRQGTTSEAENIQKSSHSGHRRVKKKNTPTAQKRKRRQWTERPLGGGAV